MGITSLIIYLGYFPLYFRLGLFFSFVLVPYRYDKRLLVVWAYKRPSVVVV